MAADPVRAAIFTCLSGDATLKGLLSDPAAIFHRQAEQGAEPAYVIFQRQAGTVQGVFGPGNEQAVWLVKGICRGESATRAEEIDARCQVLLDRVRLSTAGGTLTVLRESAVDYGENVNGDQWHHVGSNYRLFT
jgi:hypothetical protein